MEIEALEAVIDRLADLDADALADQESLIGLHRQLARLEAVVARSAAAFDQSGGYTPSGARTAAAWVQHRCRVSGRVARRELRLGRAMPAQPATARAWAAGNISTDHVGRLTSARNDRTREAFERDEEMLVGWASTLDWRDFEAAVAYWLQLADPDGTEDEEEERRNRRGVWLDQTLRGMWLGKLTLDPLSGAAVAGELERRERELFEADWAEARARLGREPVLADLRRTPAQRRADALVEMATRSAAMAPGSRRPAPLFSVLVDLDTLTGRVCELADRTIIAPGALIPWLGVADIERAVFRPGNRVECSKRSRLFTGTTRRALELRDRGCAHPYCDEPVDRCQGDHIFPYAAGGLTTQDNGEMRCGFHNRLKGARLPPEAPPPQGEPDIDAEELDDDVWEDDGYDAPTGELDPPAPPDG